MFEKFFNAEAIEKMQRRAGAGRSASDVKVERETELQDRLRAHPEEIARLWPSEADDGALGTFDYKAYCEAFHAAMARPVRVDGPLPGMPGYVEHRRLQTVINEVTLSKQWQEKRRGL